ncbi:hypothetical protein F7725_008625, partial [Dissostichus mawsoni]
MRIGPEPTTDGFIAVMYGEKRGRRPPATLWWSTPTNPSGSSTRSETPSSTEASWSSLDQLLAFKTRIPDTSHANERVMTSRRSCGFGERVDRIILLFDAHKLDISDEFSEAIRAFKGQDDKIRVDTQQLMRVYGALMWSLGKVINTPEVVRVYLGSFWAKPLQNTENRRLFEAESQDLFKDIQSLPRNAALRKLNDLIKRARLAK